MLQLFACLSTTTALPRFSSPTAPNLPPALAFPAATLEVAEGAAAPAFVEVSDPDVDEDYAGVLEATVPRRA